MITFGFQKSRDLNDSGYNFFGKTHTMECYLTLQHGVTGTARIQ